MSATGKSSNAIEFTFDGPNPMPDEATLRAAAAGAGAVEETSQTAPPAAAVAAASATPLDDVTAKPAEAQPAAAASPDPTAKPVPAADEVKTYKITVDGQELEVTEADLKTGHMRLRDYTQKTQKVAERERALAAKEKQWEMERAQLTQELQAFDQFLRSQEAIDAYRAKAFGAAAAAPPPQLDPNKPPTLAEVAEIARYNAEQVRQATLRDVEARTAEARRVAEQVGKKVELEKLETAVNSHIGSLLDKYPVLKKFEGIEDDLIGDASRFTPRSLDEARARLSEAAERRVAVIRSYAEEEKKAAAVAAAKLQQTSPEKPGGSPAKPAPGKKLTFDPKDRQARIDAGVETVQAYLNALS